MKTQILTLLVRVYTLSGVDDHRSPGQDKYPPEASQLQWVWIPLEPHLTRNRSGAA